MSVSDVALVERILVSEWQDLLPEAEVEAGSNIFELGAHSLMVGRVASRCRAQHGLDLDFAWFFQHPVIADLATFVTAQSSDS